MPDPARFNVEIKARCSGLGEARARLLEAGAVSVGTDRQIDTYFGVPRGRLKVREGTIENALIAYERPDRPGARPSAVCLASLSPSEASLVGEILQAALPVKARVIKDREILLLGAVKFHLDRVERLGEFVEIEAQSEGGRPDRAALEALAEGWREKLGLDPAALEARSYSDLILELDSGSPAGSP